MTIKLHLGDCLEVMKGMKEASVDLVVTSPPYFNLREYSQWKTYDEYLEDVERWFQALYRVLKQGRHVCWNVQINIPHRTDGERNKLPLSADTVVIAKRCGFQIEHTVVWNKTNSVAQRMFGSYPYPPTIIYTPNTEDILVFRKPGKTDLSNKNDDSKLTKEEWAEWTLSIWNMPIGHDPSDTHRAPFPLELPTRCVKLHSFVGDTVLDPFMGIGTTGVACKQLGRNFIGIEIKPEYYDIAEKRIAESSLQYRMELNH